MIELVLFLAGLLIWLLLNNGWLGLAFIFSAMVYNWSKQDE